MSSTKDQYQNMEGEISTTESYRLGETSIVRLLLTSLETISNDMLFQNIMNVCFGIQLVNKCQTLRSGEVVVFISFARHVEGILYFPFLGFGSMCPSIDEISQIILGYRYEFRMNLKTNQVTQKQLSLLAIECPEINEEYTGR